MSLVQKRLPLAAAVATLVFSGQVGAQALEEVIVTAQKRAENLQDVPISVNAFQGDAIQDAGIANLAALADYVPSLHVADASVNTNIYMRGIGSGNNRGFEQSVVMYVDGIYMGRARQFRAGFFDLDRVEVLRGPQGTLFGKNTVAGAINVATASPEVGQEMDGEINASFEEFGGQVYEGFIEGSGDALAARLAVKYRETDGYVYNAYLDEDEGATEDSGARLTLVWEPSDAFSAEFKASYNDRERIGSSSATYKYLTPAERLQDIPNTIGNPASPASQVYGIIDGFFPQINSLALQDLTTFKDNNYGVSAGDGVALGSTPDSTSETIENYSLTMNWQVGSGTVTSVTGFSTYEYFDAVDVDWLPISFLMRDDDHEFEQLSQEIRYASDSDGPFNYTVGAYYDKNELDMYGGVTFDLAFDGLYALATAGFPGGPYPDFLYATSLQQVAGGGPLAGLGLYSTSQARRNHFFDQESESFAVFAQGTYDLTDSLRVTLGFRYTEETKDVVSDQFIGDSNCGLRTDNRAGAGQPGGCNLWLDAFFSQYPFDTWNYSFVADRETDSLDPSANIQWDVGESSMLYVSYSSGFKSGGFTAADDGKPGDAGLLPPPTGLIAPGGPQPLGGASGGFTYTQPNENFEFDDESVESFEVGGKHEFGGGSVRINWAAFYSEYDDLQTSVFRGAGFTVTNAASSEVAGLEVDAQWQVTSNLRIGGNYAYLDATYGDFADAPCTAVMLDADTACGSPGSASNNDLTGERTLYGSENSGTLFADFRMPMGGMEFFVGAEVNYRGDFNSAGDNDPTDKIDSYTKVNARIGLDGGSWQVMAYGRNIFDEITYDQSFDTPLVSGTHTRFMQEPAVFGLRGTLRF